METPSAGAAFQAVYDQWERERLASQLRALTTAFAEYFQAIGRDWEVEAGQPIPSTIEGWERLAVRAGIPPEKIWDGKWTIAKISPYIVGYLDRIRDANRPEAAVEAPAAKPGKKQPIRRRKGTTPKPRPLTPRQAEVIQVVGECKGNLAESARRLGRDRKTIKETYQAGMEKLGKNVIHQKKKDRLIARDRRGAFDVSDIDDERREADETERRKYRRRQ